MMNCKEAARLIDVYLDQELNERTVFKIREHLEKCKSCFGNYQFNLALKKLIQRIGSKFTLPEEIQFKLKRFLETSI